MLFRSVAVAAGAITYERYDTRTLKRTVRRDAVQCGVNTDLPGFSTRDAQGKWSGFDVDFCRAIAAAIFDDPSKVNFVPLDASERFTELSKRKVDVLLRNSTWSMSREADYGLNFAAVSYYDGQGFMVPRSRNINTALDLDGSKVCVQDIPSAKLNVADYFRNNNMKYQEVKFTKPEEMREAYNSGKCDTFTADVSRLHAERLGVAKPDEQIILPDVISKEPLAAAVRQKDDEWMLIVKWTVYAMLNAEELGINSKNINDAVKSEKPEVKRFVGSEGAYGEQIGLTKDWAVRIVRHVGNYGEVYARNLGADTKLNIPRGLNELWNNGGIQYAPPIR